MCDITGPLNKNPCKDYKLIGFIRKINPKVPNEKLIFEDAVEHDIKGRIFQNIKLKQNENPISNLHPFIHPTDVRF